MEAGILIALCGLQFIILALLLPVSDSETGQERRLTPNASGASARRGGGLVRERGRTEVLVAPQLITAAVSSSV